MVVTNKTTITFFIPREYDLAEKFKAQHPDWTESCGSGFIGFKRQDTYAIEPNKEGDQDADDIDKIKRVKVQSVKKCKLFFEDYTDDRK